MAGQQQEPARGPFVCESCGEVWPSSRALSGHIKAHGKGKAPMVPIPSLPPPPAAFGPGPAGMMPVMPPYFLAPPPPVTAMGLGHPVAPPGLFFGGRLPRRVQVRQVRPQAPPPRDPVVSTGAGGTIRMVLLQPNHAFWTPYRMGMDAAPVELDFMGLRPYRRPVSPSPSFESWLNNA